MQNPHNPRPSPREIAVLLFPDFSNHCLANAIEPFRAANQLSGKPLYHWQFLSMDGAEIRSSSGLPVRPEQRLSDHPGGTTLMLMPSYGYQTLATPAHLRGLRAAAKRFEAVAGLDCGAWLMAAAGLLDGNCATIHWDERTAFAEAFPDVEVQDARFVIDGNRITCGGASTSFDLALEMIQQHHGSMLRLEVAALFMLGPSAPRDRNGPRRTGVQKVDDIVSIMRRHIETPLPMSEIAKATGLGARRCEALFQTHLQKTPRAVYKSIRLSEARRLLAQSRFSIAEIAGRCGYLDASAMSRAFRAEYGMSPSEARRGN